MQGTAAKLMDEIVTSIPVDIQLHPPKKYPERSIPYIWFNSRKIPPNGGILFDRSGTFGRGGFTPPSPTSTTRVVEGYDMTEGRRCRCFTCKGGLPARRSKYHRCSGASSRHRRSRAEGGAGEPEAKRMRL
jgi:hypothetical protein